MSKDRCILNSMVCIVITYRLARVNTFSPAIIYLLLIQNNGDAKTMFEVCSKLTINTAERRQRRCFAVCIVSLNGFHTLFRSFHC